VPRNGQEGRHAEAAKNLVFGFTLGIVASATLGWALAVKIPPRITAKANLVVDKAGNALFGATPEKVEMVNCPTTTAPTTLKDANGVTIGEIAAGGHRQFVTPR
jgi:hypothetical protein